MERLTDIKEVESTRKQVEHALKSVGYKDIPLMRYVKLGEYENLGLEPQQIKEISNLYAEKCKEVAELKAEIEKLKQNIVDSTNDTYSLQELDHKLLTKEIEQLKAELEQSVKLPCKVGDTVYWISHFKSGIIQGKVSGILISGFGFDLKITDATGMTITKEFEKVFLTREEAEKALAEMEKKK